MRLTLRTLLAYLDHTLDPADEAALGEKVNQSTIATDLVGRIQHVLSNPHLEAPSPTAASPNNDANAIGEYLDSTLAPELTAEVERQCLESEAHLSEVAACHQVLTIALGEPATIASNLRRRIYDMRPSPAAAAQGGNGEVAGPPGEVTPVGLADSGVAAATTRLAEEPDLGATIAAASKTIRRKHGAPRSTTLPPNAAGDRSRQQLEAIGPLLSGGRPSRVVPYLVSLALLAAFLFVLMKAFQPWTEHTRHRGVALDEHGNAPGEPADGPEIDSLVPPPVARPMTPAERATPAERGPRTVSPPSETTARPAAEPEPAAEPIPEPKPEPGPDVDSVPAAETETVSDAEGAENASSVPVGEKSIGEKTPAEGSESPAEDSNPAAMLDAAEQAATTEGSGRPGTVAPQRSTVIGSVEMNSGLLVSQNPRTGEWSRVPEEAAVTAGDVLVCAPQFRSRLMLDGGLEAELVGPTAIRIDRIETRGGGTPPHLFITVDFGRLILMATEQPLELLLASPAAHGRIVLAQKGSTAAIAVDYLRPPGSDPLDPNNSHPLLRISSVQSDVTWKQSGRAPGSAASQVSLQPGQRRTIPAGRPPLTETLKESPGWIQPATESADQEAARRGLEELLGGDQPLEDQLRRAVESRRASVAALAAQTLLNLGMAEAYFGSNGVLNRPEMRTFWPHLVGSLNAFIDRGPPSAATVAAAAGRAEGEAAGKLWFLLSGFSPDQLQRGDDEMLVQMLDDPDMSVRVIAAETLRQITGTTLGYRSDHETAARRLPALKKWQAKLRSDQIRWADPSAALGVPSLDVLPAIIETTGSSEPNAPDAPGTPQ